jgi:hypothetical protein
VLAGWSSAARSWARRCSPRPGMWSVALLLLAVARAPSLSTSATTVPDRREVSHVASPPPHIVWIVVDDLGWADVSWRSDGQTLTPALDALRRGGVELTNMQMYKFCTPTRSSFLTGRTPFHTLQHLANVPMPCTALQLNYTLLPELLRSKGYHCAHVGKVRAPQR